MSHDDFSFYVLFTLICLAVDQSPEIRWEFLNTAFSGTAQALVNLRPDHTHPTNPYPSGRHGAGFTMSDPDTAWLFGGYGYDRVDAFGKLGDLWRYQVFENRWYWLNTGGSWTDEGRDQRREHLIGMIDGLDDGTYTFPGGRIPMAFEYVPGLDSILMFGGGGRPVGDTIDQQNTDSWLYNIASGYWEYVYVTGRDNPKTPYDGTSQVGPPVIPHYSSTPIPTWIRNDEIMWYLETDMMLDCDCVRLPR